MFITFLWESEDCVSNMFSMSYCIMDNIWKTGKKNLPLVLFRGGVSATTALLGGLISQGLSKKDSVKTMVFLSVKKKARFLSLKALHSGKMANIRSLGISLLWELIWSFVVLSIQNLFPFYTISVNLTLFQVSSFPFNGGKLSTYF